MVKATQEHIQAPGLSPFEDFFLMLTPNKKTPIYMRASRAIGRGLFDERGNPKVELAYGEVAGADKLPELMGNADRIVTF